MSTKHFINDPAHLVESALRAVTLTNPGIGLDAANKILYIRPGLIPQQLKVHLISGGGSGHEPSFAGMVGPGLLSAAVAGTIFASPSAQQIRTAIVGRVPHQSKSDPESGVLVIVMNYTGDVLNFGVAIEAARAEGTNVQMVVVGDDVAVGRSHAGKVGRRGIAGTVLVHKLSGALASMGYGLTQVAALAQLVADNLVTIGASLERVHVPGVRESSTEYTSRLAPDEAEIGMGIHNEQGWCRASNTAFSDLIDTMLQYLLAQDDPERSFVDFKTNPENVVLLVNNLGGLSPLELGGIVSEAALQLKQTHGIRVLRVLSGTYMTSLDAHGFSITLLRLVNTGINGLSLLDLLDYPCEALGWPSSVPKATWEAKDLGIQEHKVVSKVEKELSGLKSDAQTTEMALVAALKSVIASEPDITRFDMIVGDGDCGTTLRRGAQAVLHHVSSHHLTGDIVVDLAAIVPVVENSMDGTSGALYAIFLNSLVRSLRSLAPGELSSTSWAIALGKSRDALAKYTPARPGDRTLVDALYPFIEILEKTGDLEKAATASMEAAEATQGLQAKLGRTVYLGDSGFEQVPDPGAWGLARFFVGLAGYEI
ncbi:unnamed protein product [Clonostachys rhizophaga]|uniref:Dihydroxyacetone kinase n=1 Tax=Clonostachys rhizophaga TaxID=160324 RepID=A0A9N9YWU6_9HYPO|nr:unnamed protein product [Clonostachys rhizophaga]